MKKPDLPLCLLTCIILLMSGCGPSELSWQLLSPKGGIRVHIEPRGDDNSKELTYRIYLKGVEILDPSPLGLIREDSRFVENLVFLSEETESGLVESYHLLTGKKREVESTYNSLVLHFRNENKERISLEFRAFDDGIAFRYLFPGENKRHLRVLEENSGFDFKEGLFWAHPYDTLSTWTPAYETYYQGPLPVGTAAPANKNGWAFPILVESEGAWMMVSEAGFDGNYGASHLESLCEDGRYMMSFPEPGEAEGFYEHTSHSYLPWHTPWRFIVLGSSLSAIVESNLPTDLAAPCQMEDSSWILPGRASWSWWSDSESPQIFERLLPFVDLAQEMEWEYSLVDANWNRMKGGTVEELASYAKTKNVGLLLWYNSGGKHNVVEEAPRDLMWEKTIRRKEFERISKMGIKGIKVDFFQSDKQEIIKQYIGILEDAADYQLLVNFHGCTLPKGWRRTWPNLLTMEAVRGGESYKFASDFPSMAPPHLCIVPFSRNVVGPVDYTPGGFSDHNYPHLTSYGFELALPVILESGLMHYMDTPEQTLSLPAYAREFLKRIPVAWDDTRFLSGYPGKDVVMARKNGEEWYVAGINGENMEKEIEVDLRTLDRVPSEIKLIIDGNGPRDLKAAKMIVVDGKLTLHMEPFGGFAGSW